MRAGSHHDVATRRRIADSLRDRALTDDHRASLKAGQRRRRERERLDRRGRLLFDARELELMADSLREAKLGC